MRAFILCLLPGLEEETGEFFEQVCVLTSLHALLLILISNSGARPSGPPVWHRLPRLLLSKHMADSTHCSVSERDGDQLSLEASTSLKGRRRCAQHGTCTSYSITNDEPDITSIVGQDTGLLIRAFAASLEDENLLVQRSALDLLLQSLPLDSKTVREANEENRRIIMRAAYSVVLRRDLSLNRRLYTWLLGSSESSQTQEEFFQKNALSLLVSTLKVGLSK
jgi:hypothetical protein